MTKTTQTPENKIFDKYIKEIFTHLSEHFKKVKLNGLDSVIQEFRETLENLEALGLDLATHRSTSKTANGKTLAERLCYLYDKATTKDYLDRYQNVLKEEERRPNLGSFIMGQNEDEKNEHFFAYLKTLNEVTDGRAINATNIPFEFLNTSFAIYSNPDTKYYSILNQAIELMKMDSKTWNELLQQTDWSDEGKKKSGFSHDFYKTYVYRMYATRNLDEFSRLTELAPRGQALGIQRIQTDLYFHTQKSFRWLIKHPVFNQALLERTELYSSKSLMEHAITPETKKNAFKLPDDLKKLIIEYCIENAVMKTIDKTILVEPKGRF